MKKSDAILVKAAIFLLFIPFSGCKKLQDYILKHPGATHPDCRITKFTSTSNYPQKTGIVYYNKFGNPDSVIFDNTSTGQPNMHFFYDKKNRLTDCIGLYSGGSDTAKSVFEWNKYIYDSKNRIVGDTTYGFLIYKPGSLKPIPMDDDEEIEFYSISHYTLDSKDRIIKRTITGYPDMRVDSVTYTYGQDGNLIVPNVQYDNNISFLRTHEIWMLLSFDYSVNNPFIASEYNSKGLPTNFGPNTPLYNYRFLYTSLKNMIVEYSCK